MNFGFAFVRCFIAINSIAISMTSSLSISRSAPRKITPLGWTPPKRVTPRIANSATSAT